MTQLRAQVEALEVEAEASKKQLRLARLAGQQDARRREEAERAAEGAASQLSTATARAAAADQRVERLKRALRASRAEVERGEAAAADARLREANVVAAERKLKSSQVGRLACDRDEEH